VAVAHLVGARRRASAGAGADPPAPKPKQGRHRLDVTASALVLLMKVPGSLFYGGLVRTKKPASMMMQVLLLRTVWSASLGDSGSAWPLAGGAINAY